MQKITVDDPESRSADIVAENLDQLKALFPEVFVDDKVDFQVLKQLLGSAVDEREEKYGLNWHGKRQARQLALTPSTGTLRPCPEDSVDWDTTQNLMIEGDNLEVLKLLQKSYAGKVKLIYIDPPYNTGNEFIYPDNFTNTIESYLELTGQTNQENQKLSSNTEASGRFHTAWLNMMFPRLKLARTLLAEDGCVFISIDDHEVNRLRTICDDVFGEENFIATVIWQKVYAPKNSARHLSVDHDYILVYSRNADSWRPKLLPRSEEADARYRNIDDDSRGPWKASDLTARNFYSRGTYEVIGPTGKTFTSGVGRYWRQSHESLQQMDQDNRIWWGANGDAMPAQKRFLSEVQDGLVPQTIWYYKDVGHTQEAKKELITYVPFKRNENVLNTVKPTRLIQQILLMGTIADAEDIVLDFFAGSATTGHAVLTQNRADGGNRRFVCVQMGEPLPKPEEAFGSIFQIGTTRLTNVAAELADTNPPLCPVGDLGFRVFKLDTSNIHAWEPDRDNLDRTLLESIEHIKPDRSEEDILYELLLKLGLDLCVPVESRAIAGKAVRSIGAGTLIACLDETIDRNDVEPLASGISDWHAELAPAGDSTVVFRDSAFVDDVAKTNLAAILEQRGLGTVRSL